jgi:hypothetical protein
MRKIVDTIKEHSFSDYRHHVPGVICEIKEFNQYIGFSAVLKVIPLDSESEYISSEGTPKNSNVMYCGAAGIYGLPASVKDTCYAYVMTDNPSLLEGKPAIIIPKSFLLSNPGLDHKVEPDILSKTELKKLVMRKEDLIASRKLS